ncbi:MAG TPA: hypothetical protein VEX68_24450 [Bryobacteraceae bacterium]|nr:hypothetical protein [Bryobacteraceae bacterium]
MELFVDDRNYGEDQKTYYGEALKARANIIVMVHSDYQYGPRLLPQIIEPIEEGEVSDVLARRWLSRHAMSWWKYVSTRFLTGLEDKAGYSTYRREAREAVNLELKVAEVPVPICYFSQTSSASFMQSSTHGLSILWLLLRFELHRLGVVRQRQFQSLHRRYSGAQRREDEPALL